MLRLYNRCMRNHTTQQQQQTSTSAHSKVFTKSIFLYAKLWCGGLSSKQNSHPMHVYVSVHVYYAESHSHDHFTHRMNPHRAIASVRSLSHCTLGNSVSRCVRAYITIADSFVRCFRLIRCYAIQFIAVNKCGVVWVAVSVCVGVGALNVCILTCVWNNFNRPAFQCFSVVQFQAFESTASKSVWFEPSVLNGVGHLNKNELTI